jgi:hypothetical protein
MDNIGKVINDFYKKRNYLDDYGGSLFMTILIFGVFFSLISYYHIMNNLDPIKADWVNQRCSPGVIPFAGLINPPKDGTSAFDYTSENFTFCIQNILKQITSYAFLPINSFVNMILEVFKEMKEAISSMRNIFNSIRDKFKEMSQELFGRLLNIMIPIQNMVIGLKDMIAKGHGVFTASLYTALGGYMTLKAAIGAVFELIIIILIALAALIIILWIIPFTWGAAAAMTGIFVAVAIPLAVVAIMMSDVFDLHSSSIPGKPHCFSGDTTIKTQDGEIPIKDVKVGTILRNNTKVTATFKLSSKKQKMYTLHDIRVSGNHKVLHNFKWIKVEEHPYSTLIENFNEPFIYCLNTTNKTIQIGDQEFTDWDDMSTEELNEIRFACSHMLPKREFKPKYLHTYLDSGFIKGTPITLKSGRDIPIESVKVDDLLLNGEKVIGIVEIDGSDIVINKYFFDDKSFIGGPNIQLYDFNLGILNTCKLVKHESRDIYDKIYHILTDKNTLTSKGITFFDYNVAIEGFLEEDNRLILSSLFR